MARVPCAYPECECDDQFGPCQRAVAAGLDSFTALAIAHNQDSHVTCCTECGKPAGEPHHKKCPIRNKK